MSKPIFLILTLFLLGFPFAVSLNAQTEHALSNVTCPVMPGERIKSKFHVDYQGKRVYLCCRNCERSFKKNPGKYLKNLELAQPQ